MYARRLAFGRPDEDAAYMDFRNKRRPRLGEPVGEEPQTQHRTEDDVGRRPQADVDY